MRLDQPDISYQNLIEACLRFGEEVQTRNSKVKRLIGWRMEFASTPLITIRKTAWKNCLREWEFFMSGSNRLEDMHKAIHHWWKSFADEKGKLNFNYSQQFRHFYGCDRDGLNQELIHYDQIEGLIEGIKKHPNSRRNVITTWNSAEMNEPDCVITNCHNSLTQLFVESGKLTLYTTQRSSDIVCGLSHNLLQEWAFLMWLASRCSLEVGRLIWNGTDCHIYEQHYALAEKILEQREQDSPQLVYKSMSEDFKADDFTLDRPYEPALNLRAEMVV